MRNQKGITLIALVITIIVLLILAGVSIAMLTGQNGILTRATDTNQATIEAEAKEKINLALNEVYTNILANKDAEVKPTMANTDDIAFNVGDIVLDGATVITITADTAYTDFKGYIEYTGGKYTIHEADES